MKGFSKEHPARKLLETLDQNAKSLPEWHINEFFKECQKGECDRFFFDWSRQYGVTISCDSWIAGCCKEKIKKNPNLIETETVTALLVEVLLDKVLVSRKQLEDKLKEYKEIEKRCPSKLWVEGARWVIEFIEKELLEDSVKEGSK